MRSGILRHRLTLQRRHDARGPGGGLSSDWVDVATGIPASIEPLNGRALFTAQQHAGEITARIRMRYRPDVQLGMRLLHGGVVYVIVTPPINDRMQNRELTLMCSSALHEG